jgi:hypothetical protein
MDRGRRASLVFLIAAGMIVFESSSFANHSWNGYHWARRSNPFQLKLGDNVANVWDPFLATTSSDWSKSTVLDTAIVPGGTRPKSCRPTSGRVEVCSASYGGTGWLGIAQVWVSGSHITQGTVKVNDTYFDTTQYNTPGWRNLVMCQEVGHTLGLDHQDTNFNNGNLGTCMDYTNNPYGPPDNEHPNQHDYDELATIYSHADGGTTVGQVAQGTGQDLNDPREWGQLVRANHDGRLLVFERDLGNGQKIFTFVLRTE